MTNKFTNMTIVKLSIILSFSFILLVKSSDLNEYYAPHITAVLKYLNANPNKVYEYKKGALLEAQQKADITELLINVDASCILNTQYEGVPCTEGQQICNGFVQKLSENEYKVLSDITCKPKVDTSTESVDEITTLEPFIEEGSNIELSHEAVSAEQKADFVAVKADIVPCDGCPVDLDENVEGISTLVNTALRHLETERTNRHALVKVIRLQEQIVAGIKYILLLEVAPTVCQKDVDVASNCPKDENALTSVCEVTFIQKPWINKLKYIFRNNCTVSQEYNIDLENQSGNNNDNEVRVNLYDNRKAQNSSSENGNTNEISPESLFDLESQILPVEDVSGKAETTNPANNDNSNSKSQVTLDNSYKQTNLVRENEDSNSSPNKTIESGNDAVYNNDNIISGVDIELNKVKRSLGGGEDIQQDLSDNGRYRRDLVGAPGNIDVNDTKILQFTQDALTKLDSESDNPNRHKIVNIVSATSQVVAGIKYSIKAEISLSDCSKNDSTLLQDCGFLQNAKIKKCNITVWDRPWLNKRETTLQCDDTKKKYVFETAPARIKRSVNIKYGGSVENVSEYNETSPKILEYIKTGLRHLNSKSVLETTYVVKKIVKISKQVVSGRLWQITVELGLSNCPKHQYIEQCPDVETNTSKLCNFRVWEQPWLTKTPNINILCEDDTDSNDLQSQQTSDMFDKVLGTFQDFMVKYNKSYLNEIDLNYRLKIFRDNLNTIKLLNKYEQGTAEYGITQFTDLTSSEFSKSHGLRLDLHNENNIPFMTAATPNITLPKEFDWRDKGAVTKVKNQGSCGSCWAFSTTGNIEGQYAIKYGKLLEFSEQELVDCDKLDEGCNGGLMDNAYRTIEEIGGLESESDYPYDGENAKCHFSKSKVEVQLTGALNISHNETDMAKWLVKNGPIAIGINANAMQFYVGGVSHPWKMLCNPNNLDHGVLIVGYGVHYYPLFKKTLPYWIVKNSWGSSWGEQGYYRVYRGDGTCGVNQTPSSSIVA